MPLHGYMVKPSEGSIKGTITGIGTATATLNAQGLGEVEFGSQVAAAGTNTTITTFAGLKPGQIFVLWNYQVTRTVTIKHGGSTGNIVLKPTLNGTFNGYTADAVMTTYGQMIVFYVTGLGRAYEIGRNF